MFPLEKRIAIPYMGQFVIVLTLMLDKWEVRSVRHGFPKKTEPYVVEVWDSVILERSIIKRLWRRFTVFYERWTGDGLFAGAAAELMEDHAFFDTAEEALNHAKRRIDQYFLDSEEVV
jgi:hypothetical protein